MTDKERLAYLITVLNCIKHVARPGRREDRIQDIRDLVDEAIFEAEKLRSAADRTRAWWAFWRVGK